MERMENSTVGIIETPNHLEGTLDLDLSNHIRL